MSLPHEDYSLRTACLSLLNRESPEKPLLNLTILLRKVGLMLQLYPDGMMEEDTRPPLPCKCKVAQGSFKEFCNYSFKAGSLNNTAMITLTLPHYLISLTAHQSNNTVFQTVKDIQNVSYCSHICTT